MKVIAIIFVCCVVYEEHAAVQAADSQEPEVIEAGFVFGTIATLVLPRVARSDCGDWGECEDADEGRREGKGPLERNCNSTCLSQTITFSLIMLARVISAPLLRSVSSISVQYLCFNTSSSVCNRYCCHGEAAPRTHGSSYDGLQEGPAGRRRGRKH